MALIQMNEKMVFQQPVKNLSVVAAIKGSAIWNAVIAKKIWLQSSFLVAAFAFLYASTFQALINTWIENRAYSHGFLVPLISLCLVWIKRNKLKYLPLQPAIPAGIIALIFTGFMFTLGSLSGVILLQEISLVLMIAGLALTLLGAAYLRALAFPIAYLFFMIPILDAITDNIHWPLQLFAAKVGTMMLHRLGVPVFLKSQYIELPNITLEVAVQCSGLRYMIAIIAIGIPLAHLTQKTWVRKVLLLSMAIIIAIIANAARVAFVGYWAYYYDSINTHGPFHIFQGFLVSQIGFITLFIGAWLFYRIPTRFPQKAQIAELTTNSIEPPMKGGFGCSWYVAISILFFLVSYPYINSPKPVILKKGLKELPRTIEDWKGEDNGTKPLLIEKTNHEITRIYRNNSGREIKLFIGYFESQHQGKELVNYITRRLHNGAVEIDIPIRDSFIRVNKTILSDSYANHSVLFWYDLNGRVMTSPYKTKLATTLDALFRGRTNGAIVMVAAPLYNKGNLSEILEAQKKFIQDITPVLHDYLPD